MTPRWPYLLLAALLGVGVTVAVSTLNRVRHERSVHEFDWGDRIQLSTARGVVNRVNVVAPFDAGERRFSYYTGGNSPGSGESSEAPARVIAEGAHGAVTVRLLAFDPYARESGADDAKEIARIVSLATTQVWPGRPTPVQVDVHFMPGEPPFSQAKRVDWREGDAYALAVFQREGSLQSHTPAHELYHALAGRWSLGQNNPANRARPRAALAYEETAAALFAECGRLLASGSLTRDTRNAVLVSADQRFEGDLDSEELARALDRLRQDAGLELLGPFLARTVLADVFGDEETIALRSPQGERLVARCRESAANPMLLAFRLAEILRATEAETEPRVLEN